MNNTNVMAVGASDSSDDLWAESNYGKTTVQVMLLVCTQHAAVDSLQLDLLEALLAVSLQSAFGLVGCRKHCQSSQGVFSSFLYPTDMLSCCRAVGGAWGVCPELWPGRALCQDDRHFHGHTPCDWCCRPSSSTVSTFAVIELSAVDGIVGVMHNQCCHAQASEACAKVMPKLHKYISLLQESSRTQETRLSLLSNKFKCVLMMLLLFVSK